MNAPPASSVSARPDAAAAPAVSAATGASATPAVSAAADATAAPEVAAATDAAAAKPAPAPADRSVAPESAGWQARLHLGFAHDGSRTVLQERTHEGPLYVQRPFYPEGGACHVYILHPPAGMVGGDRLVTDVDVAGGAAALITTPASAKIYRSAGPVAAVHQKLTVEDGGVLEWLPQDTILFGGSSTAIHTEILLEKSARFMGWELLTLGRPRSGDHYRAGNLVARTRISVAGAPRLIERQLWRAGDAVLEAPWGLGGKRVVAAFYVYPAPSSLLQSAREFIANGGCECSAATLLDDLLVMRALGNDATAMRETVAAIWSQLRKNVLGRPGCAPRIWAT